MNIWVKEGWNERQMCLNMGPATSRRIQSEWNCLPNPGGPLSPDSLPLMFPSFVSLLLFPCDCSQETFLEKPQGIDFLCALGQQTVCVLLAAAVLQPLGTEGGTASQEHKDGSRIGGEARQEKNTKTIPGWETGWTRRW